MQVIDDPYRSVGAGVGASFGKGLAESIPKAANEYRLSKSLESLKSGDYDPISSMQQLIRGGATESQLAMFMPYIERLYENKMGQKRASDVREQQGPIYGEQEQPKAEIAPSEEPSKFKKLISKDEELAFQNPVKRLSGNELLLETEKAFNKGGFRSWKDAENFVVQKNERDIQQNEDLVKQYQRKKEQVGNLQSEIEKRSGFNLESFNLPGQAGESSGRYYQKVLDEAQDDVVNGMTVDQAAKKAGDNLKSFSDARLNIEKGLAQATASGREKQATIEQNRNAYAERDLLPLFVEDQVKGGLSYPKAAQNAYPLERNKNIKKEIDSIKLPQRVSEVYIGKTGQDLAEALQMKTRTFTDKIAKHINDEDSLLSIANGIKEKGYDPVSFMDEIKTLHENKMLKLNARQIEEMGKVTDYDRSLLDLWIDWRQL